MNDQKFQEEVLNNYEKAELMGIKVINLLQTIKKRGASATAKDMIRRQVLSDGFERLNECGQISLTLEAAVAKAEYADLFTDEEVNYCFEILCEHGYFG